MTTCIKVFIFLLFAKGSVSVMRHIFVPTGESAILNCSNPPNNTVIQWLRLNQRDDQPETTYSNGWTVSSNHEDRVKIVGSKGDKKYDLQIINVTVNDSGLYRCALVDGNVAKSFDVYLTITDPVFSTAAFDNNLNSTNTTNLFGKGFVDEFVTITLFVIIGILCGCLVITAIIAAIVHRMGRARTMNEATTQPSPFWRTSQSVEVPSEMQRDTAEVEQNPNIQDIPQYVENGNSSLAGIRSLVKSAHETSRNVRGACHQAGIEHVNPYQSLKDNRLQSAHVYSQTMHKQPSTEYANPYQSLKGDRSQNLHVYSHTLQMPISGNKSIGGEYHYSTIGGNMYDYAEESGIPRVKEKTENKEPFYSEAYVH